MIKTAFNGIKTAKEQLYFLYNLVKLLIRHGEMIRVTKWDKLLIITVFFLSTLGMVYVKSISTNTDNLYLAIEIDGKPYKTISLGGPQKNQLITVETPAGNNLIEVEGNRVRMKEADCRDQLCVKTGWLSRANQISICLPNRVSIKLIGGKEDDIDIISY